MDSENTELCTIWEEARQHVESGNVDKAIEIYKYVLVRYGDDAVAVEYANACLADLHLTLLKPDLTESHIQKAIKLKPENAGYLYILGFVYFYRVALTLHDRPQPDFCGRPGSLIRWPAATYIIHSIQSILSIYTYEQGLRNPGDFTLHNMTNQGDPVHVKINGN